MSAWLVSDDIGRTVPTCCCYDPGLVTNGGVELKDGLDGAW